MELGRRVVRSDVHPIMVFSRGLHRLDVPPTATQLPGSPPTIHGRGSQLAPYDRADASSPDGFDAGWWDDVIRLIAAMDSKRGIATSAGIPWKLPGDAAYFRERTARGLILMGRATYNEFAAPLHGRENFVLSTQPGPLRTGFQAVGSLDQLRDARPAEDIWVIGGAAVYAETISEAQELLITEVQGDFNCTKFFPAFQDAFALTGQGDDRQDGGVSYRFETWKRL
jgi:dihydrofolate reductase